MCERIARRLQKYQIGNKMKQRRRIKARDGLRPNLEASKVSARQQLITQFFKPDFKHTKAAQVKVNIGGTVGLGLDTDGKEVDTATADACVGASDQHVNSDVGIDLVSTDPISTLELYQIMADAREDRERAGCGEDVGGGWAWYSAWHRAWYRAWYREAIDQMAATDPVATSRPDCHCFASSGAGDGGPPAKPGRSISSNRNWAKKQGMEVKEGWMNACVASNPAVDEGALNTTRGARDLKWVLESSPWSSCPLPVAGASPTDPTAHGERLALAATIWESADDVLAAISTQILEEMEFEIFHFM